MPIGIEAYETAGSVRGPFDEGRDLLPDVVGEGSPCLLGCVGGQVRCHTDNLLVRVFDTESHSPPWVEVVLFYSGL